MPWITRPGPGEYLPYYGTYIQQVPDGDVLALLEKQLGETRSLLAPVPAARWRHRYAPGKWSLAEVVGHVIDVERVFSHRALRFARGDATPLPGFDEKIYARHSDAESRPWVDLLEEYQVVRAATIALFRSLPPGAWTRAGEVNGYRATPRGLAFHVAGHELHHLRIVRERYLSLPRAG